MGTYIMAAMMEKSWSEEGSQSTEREGFAIQVFQRDADRRLVFTVEHTSMGIPCDLGS